MSVSKEGEGYMMFPRRMRGYILLPKGELAFLELPVTMEDEEATQGRDFYQ